MLKSFSSFGKWSCWRSTSRKDSSATPPIFTIAANVHELQCARVDQVFFRKVRIRTMRFIVLCEHSFIPLNPGLQGILRGFRGDSTHPGTRRAGSERFSKVVTSSLELACEIVKPIQIDAYATDATFLKLIRTVKSVRSVKKSSSSGSAGTRIRLQLDRMRSNRNLMRKKRFSSVDRTAAGRSRREQIMLLLPFP